MAAPLERYAEWTRTNRRYSVSSLPSRPTNNRLDLARSEIVLATLYIVAGVYLAYRQLAWAAPILLVAAVLLLTEFRRARRNTLRALEALERQVELHDDSFLGLAIVEIKRGNQSMGEDVGAVHVDDHFLHFHGLQTEFSISANTFTIDLTLRSDPTYRISFRPVDALTPDRSFTPNVLQQRVERAFRTAPDEAFALLPPATRQPKIWRVAGLTAVLLLSVAAIPGSWIDSALCVVFAFVVLFGDFKRPPGRTLRSRWWIASDGTPMADRRGRAPRDPSDHKM